MTFVKGLWILGHFMLALCCAVAVAEMAVRMLRTSCCTTTTSPRLSRAWSKDSGMKRLVLFFCFFFFQDMGLSFWGTPFLVGFKGKPKGSPPHFGVHGVRLVSLASSWHAQKRSL